MRGAAVESRLQEDVLVAEMQFGLMLRTQFPQGDDMQARFQELLEQARLANELGYASITKGMHYRSSRSTGPPASTI